MLRGEYETVDQRTLELQSKVEELPDPGRAQTNLDLLKANLHWRRGQLTQASQLLESTLGNSRRSGDQQSVMNCVENLGGIAFELGQADKAIEYLTEAITIGDSLGHGTAYRLGLSTFYAQGGEREKARQLLEEAGAQLDKQGRGVTDQYMESLASAYLGVADGYWDAAWESFDEIRTRLIEYDLPWELADLQRQWAAAHAARGEQGDIERARELYSAARDGFAELGAGYYTEKVDLALEKCPPASSPG